MARDVHRGHRTETLPHLAEVPAVGGGGDRDEFETVGMDREDGRAVRARRAERQRGEPLQGGR